MGPTASGKTALGISLAQERGGVILNADTMQCYADLRVITARPSEEEEAQAKHRMYGIWSAETMGNAALWMDLVSEEIRRVWAEGKLPILLGGTGMYLKTLQEGISPVPDIPLDLREHIRARWQADPDAFYAELQARDPEAAARFTARDKQRIVRAMEVLEHTGKSLSYWQSQPTQSPLPEAAFKELVVDRPREEVYARIDKRFEWMIEHGAIEEVQALVERLGLERESSTPDYPILRALGVPEIRAYLREELSREEMVALGQQKTRNYAKRQLTWIRNQCVDAEKIVV